MLQTLKYGCGNFVLIIIIPVFNYCDHLYYILPVSYTSVQELKAYLGLLTYYGKFLPKLSSVLFPLYRLLRKDVAWEWSEEEEKAFSRSKKMLTSSNLLTHYNPQLPLTLACDASAYGIGAVLAHRMSDGSEKPIGYVSRTLTKAEKNYSQLEKEGLSCVSGIKKFHNYVFGRHFELVTDHKPLLGLLKENVSVCAQASPRVKRWSLFFIWVRVFFSFQKHKCTCKCRCSESTPTSCGTCDYKQIQNSHKCCSLLCKVGQATAVRI